MVLVLQEASVAPADHLYRKNICALLNIRSDIKFRGEEAILSIPKEFSIEPHLKARTYSAKMQSDIHITPRRRYCKCPLVASYAIVVLWDIRWIDRTKWIHRTFVNGLIISFQFP